MGNRSANPFTFLSSLGSRMGHPKEPLRACSRAGAGADALASVGEGAGIQAVEARDQSESGGMRDDLAIQYNVLIRELSSLDALLRGVPQWGVVCRAERALAQRGPERTKEREQDRRTLREARQQLSQNRVFVARERIVEAVLLICEEMDRKAPADALYPLADETSKVADRAAQAGTSLPDGSQIHATIRMSPRGIGGGDRFVSDPNRPPDNLTRIRSINAPLAKKLNALGVRHFSQIASWNAHDVASVRAALTLGERIARENWIEQAALLAGPEALTNDARAHSETRNGGRIDGEMKRKKASPCSKASPRRAPGKARPVESQSDESRVSEAAKAIFNQIQRMPAVVEGVRAPAPANTNRKVEACDGGGAAQRDGKSDEAPKTPAPDVPGPSVTVAADTTAADAEAVAAVATAADRLQAIRGIDDATAAKLAQAGVTRFEQISAWGPKDVANIDDMISCRERIARECWIEQAAVLARPKGATAYARHVSDGTSYQRSATLVGWGGDNAVLPDVAAYFAPVAAAAAAARDGAMESAPANGRKRKAVRATPPPLKQRQRATAPQTATEGGAGKAHSGDVRVDATNTPARPGSVAADAASAVSKPVDKSGEPEISVTLKDRLKNAGTNGAAGTCETAPAANGTHDANADAASVTVAARTKKAASRPSLVSRFARQRKHPAPSSRDERPSTSAGSSGQGRSSGASYGQYSGHIGEASVSIIRGGKTGNEGGSDAASEFSEGSVPVGHAGHIEIDYSYGENSGGLARRWLRALLGR